MKGKQLRRLAAQRQRARRDMQIQNHSRADTAAASQGHKRPRPPSIEQRFEAISAQRVIMAKARKLRRARKRTNHWAYVIFPANMVRTVRAGRRRRRSPELAGRPPAGGGTAANRGGREDSPPVSLAGLRFFPAKMVRTVRAGRRRRSSPELAGRPPAGGGSAPNRGGREDSPPMALVGLHFPPQIWSNPSEKGPRRKSSPDLAGPPPASGGRIFLRPMGVVAGEITAYGLRGLWIFHLVGFRRCLKLMQLAHPYNRFAIFC